MTGLATWVVDRLLRAESVERIGECSGVVDTERILLDFIPRHEEAFKLGLTVASGDIFAVEESSDTLSCGFIHNHSVWAVKDTRAGRLNDFLRCLVFGSHPQTDFGAVDEVVVAAASGVRFFGSTELDFTVTLNDTLDIL